MSSHRRQGTGMSTLAGVHDFGSMNTTLNLSASVPEPSTWAMNLTALALLGVVLRRSGRY